MLLESVSVGKERRVHRHEKSEGTSFQVERIVGVHGARCLSEVGRPVKTRQQITARSDAEQFDGGI